MIAALATAMLLAAPTPLDDLVLDLEAGPLAIPVNDQRYGAAGTAYTAGTVALDRNLFLASRTVVEARAFGRHTLLLTHAPLDVTTRVALGAPFTFRDATFPAGAVIDHRYLFESWRAGYLFRAWSAGPLTLEGGATFGVRNAVVSVSEVAGGRFAAERDLGPIPALKARARYDAERGYALLDVDGGGTIPGLGTVRGGILDAALTLGVPLLRGMDGTLRLRYLTGGADVPAREITNWATLTSASLGLRLAPMAWGEEVRP